MSEMILQHLQYAGGSWATSICETQLSWLTEEIAGPMRTGANSWTAQEAGTAFGVFAKMRKVSLILGLLPLKLQTSHEYYTTSPLGVAGKNPGLFSRCWFFLAIS